MGVHADGQGKLIDGGEAKRLTFTREYDRLLGGLKVPHLPDVPLAVYDLSGEEILPGRNEEASRDPAGVQKDRTVK